MTPKSLLHPARLARRPVLSTQSDARLVDLVRAGYDPAFETIVERYRAQLLRYAGRILPGGRAEDVVQLAFVRAYEAMRRDTRTLDLRPWLYRIVHNAALNALRDRRPASAELSEQLDGVERPDQALERSQGLREVLAAVQALPGRQRDAIVLRELEGRSYDEIATALGVSGGAVRQLLNRARNTLRAGATAVAPAGWLARIPWESSAEPLAARLGEGLGAAGAGALAAKLCATALVTGAVVGGVAVAPDGDRRATSSGEAQAAESASSPTGPGSGAVQPSGASGSRGPGGGGSDSGPGGSSGPGERSGPGDGSGSRGSGDGGADDGEGSSGPGGSGGGDADGGDGTSGSAGSGGSGDGDDADRSGDDSSGPGGSGGSGDGDGDGGSSGSDGSGELTSDPTLLEAAADYGESGSSGSGSSSSGSSSSGSG